MRVEFKDKNIILSDVADFDLFQTFECGQCFRWDKVSDNAYIGIAVGKALKIEKRDNSFVLYNTTKEDFDNIWYRYFDFETDYSAIKTALGHDSVMQTAIAYGEGIRILRQDLWETVVSFIISASNNIPRIKKIISAFCDSFGEPTEYMGRVYHLFPTPDVVASLSLEDLAVIKAGFRDKYILDAARRFASGDMDFLREMNNNDAKKQLMTIKGVGNKVADCVMLFGLYRRDSFPVDVWINRIMEYCYFNSRRRIEDISDFAYNKFGQYCGYAQQYLFFYARENQIDT